MYGYDYEGLSSMAEPYKVYFDKEEAERVATGLRESGDYQELVEVYIP